MGYGLALLYSIMNVVAWTSGDLEVLARQAADLIERSQAEQVQRQSEQRFREMIDALPVAIYTTDANGRLTHFNPAAVEFSGRVPELGTDSWCVSWKLYRPDGTVLPHDECPMAIALKEGRTVRGAEAIAERPDGKRLWFTPYPTPLRDANGKIVGGINMLLDITERKQADETRARLAAIIESSDDAIISKDLNGVITSWNQGAERLFGYTAEEAIGQPVTMLMPPDGFNEEPGILERIRRGKSIQHYETVRRRKDGTLLDISLAVSPIADTQGKIVGASKIARDISERVRAEQKIRESAERFRFLAESMPQKVFTAKPDGQADYFNQQWNEFTGSSFAELKGVGWVRLVHPDDVGETIRRWQRSVETGEPFQIEHRFRGKDGVYRWHLTRAHAMRDPAGKVLMWISSNTDIEDQKRAEEYLSKSVAEQTAQLQETVGHLEAFSYSIVHDLRAPLRAMQGFAEMLAEECAAQVGPQGHDYIRRIVTSAHRMDKLIQDVLSYNRVARIDLELGPVKLHALLLGILESYPIFQLPHAEIQVEGILPDVMGNEAALTQCLSNLLGNAVKFVAPGTRPRVRVWTQTGEHHVRLFFQDNGIGIPKDAQEQIFGIFQRQSKNYEGTGIGLAIVRKAVERMGGKVGIESESGRGSTFWIELKKVQGTDRGGKGGLDGIS